MFRRKQRSASKSERAKDILAGLSAGSAHREPVGEHFPLSSLYPFDALTGRAIGGRENPHTPLPPVLGPERAANHHESAGVGVRIKDISE